MRRFLFLPSFYIGNPKNCKHKKYIYIYIKNGPCQLKTWQKNFKKRKKKKIKNTKIKMCKGGGGGGPIFTICCLISNTLPKLEQSSFHQQQFSLIATCYNHLRLLHLHRFRKENRSSNRLVTPLARGLRSQKGLRPFGPSTHYRIVTIFRKRIPTQTHHCNYMINLVQIWYFDVKNFTFHPNKTCYYITKNIKTYQFINNRI